MSTDDKGTCPAENSRDLFAATRTIEGLWHTSGLSQSTAAVDGHVCVTPGDPKSGYGRLNLFNDQGHRFWLLGHPVGEAHILAVAQLHYTIGAYLDALRTGMQLANQGVDTRTQAEILDEIEQNEAKIRAMKNSIGHSVPLGLICKCERPAWRVHSEWHARDALDDIQWDRGALVITVRAESLTWAADLSDDERDRKIVFVCEGCDTDHELTTSVPAVIKRESPGEH